MSNEKSGKAMMVALPVSTLNFVQSNPTIAKAVAYIITKRQEILEIIRESDAVLNDPSSFESMIENGTREELENFLKEVVHSLGNGKVRSFDNLSDEEVDEILKVAKVKTEVLV